ncbi:MAG TPA: nucleotide exchange factor GrpE [Ktedonobacterales bacterium]|jgi:molecular chaperone GrpE
MTLEEQEAEPQQEAAETRESAAPAEQAKQEAAPDLAAELEREREKATDYMNRWQRAQADLANYKRRAEQEREQERKYGLAPLFLELLKMQDNFHRAFDTLPVELREFSWVQGVALTYAHLDGLVRLYGVTPVETKPGQSFDPAIHEAVAHEETDAYPDGAITAEYQRGYRIHDRVLRPALVRVAKPKSAGAASQGEPSGEAQQTESAGG